MTIRQLLLSAFLLTCVMGAMPSTASAASFDCARAAAPDETTVCRTPDLSALDSEMGALWFAYKQMPLGTMGVLNARREDAQAFLQTRKICGSNVDCLRSAYRARIAVLKDNIRQASDYYRYLQADQMFTLPVAVSALVAETRAECRKLGGRLDGGADAPAFVRTQDFDGDGKPDYLIDKRHLACKGAATAFCHNNGCDMEIALSGKGYRHPIRETGALRAIEDGPDGAVIRIEVDKSRCGAGLGPEKKCLLMLAWRDGHMKTVYQEDPPGN
ncbi:lysozyme inhibitor LprI family protein [Parvibaculum sp. MBR-TMA-1.3b-4.2]|jgi:uncharacterized protein